MPLDHAALNIFQSDGITPYPSAVVNLMRAAVVYPAKSDILTGTTSISPVYSSNAENHS